MTPFSNLYDLIAQDYKAKRSQPWKYFLKFLEDIDNLGNDEKRPIHGICCDLGCGTGRHTSLISNKADIYLGLDLSFEMIKLGRKSQLESNLEDKNNKIVKQQWIACDIEHIPLRNDSLSSIVSIAVIHHILSKIKRKELLNYLNDILKENGNIILSVWGCSIGEKGKSAKKRDYFLCMSEKKQFCIPQKKNNEKILGLRKNDVYIPWRILVKNKGKIEIPRVYHLFTYSELQEFEKYFRIITIKIYPNIHSVENKDVLNRAGINYFLFLKKI